MITNVAFVFIFCCPYEIMVGDDDKCNVHCCLLLFLWNQGKTQQRTHLILVFFFFFPCIAKNNDEPPHSSSSSTIQEKKNIETQKRTASLPTHHHPLQPKKKNLDVGFSWVARDDNEPPNSSLSLSFFSSFLENNDKPRDSSSSLGFFFKCRRRQWVGIPTYHCSWLLCFSCRRWQRASWLVIILCINFYKCKKQRRAERLVVLSWFFFFKCRKWQR